MRENWLLIAITENTPHIQLHDSYDSAKNALLTDFRAACADHMDEIEPDNWEELVALAMSEGVDTGDYGLNDKAAYSRLDNDENKDWCIVQVPDNPTYPMELM